MKVWMLLGKAKKFRNDWCIHHRMATDNAEGGGRLQLYFHETDLLF